MNKLILGDNLEILKQIESETIDLIYLDPPFFSNRNYEVIWGDEGEVRSFVDRWSGGVEHYIAWLKERVIEMHRILKSTGSIFLHCDYHADAYIRVEILDKVFGYNNFRNEIIWCYKKWSVAGKSFSKNHDSIFFYTKTNEYNYNQLFQERAESTLKRFGNQKIVSSFDEDGHRMPSQTLDEQSKGVKMSDWWEIPIVPPSGNERIGYPTQKPKALLQRILECVTNEGDTVLDPFVGGGTTVAVAEKLNRNWIGIDQSVQAVKVTEMRLQNQMDMFSNPFIVQLHKYDYDTLRYKDAFEFESWIITQFGGQPQNKKGGDKGIDGKSKENAPIQVKRSDDIGVNVIKNFFVSTMQYDKTLFEKNKAEQKPVGYIIAFSFGKGAIQEAARLKNHEDVIIKLIRVDEIIPIAKKPTLTVELTDKSTDSKGQHEIEFKATGHSAAGVEFYSWDFNYKDNQFKAEVLLDKKGEQTWKFKAGLHIIAVKVVDNDGLENIEVIRLKVNGVVERQN